MQIENIPLFHVDFWVQIHNLPAGMMIEKVGRAMAKIIGEFVEYDKNNNTSFWREYMRVRVKIDVRVSLKRQTKVKSKGGDWCVVNFKYEKLNLFCFVCGKLGHAENRCEIRFMMKEDNGIHEWSGDLRANNRRTGDNASSRWLKSDGYNNEKEKVRNQDQPVLYKGGGGKTATGSRDSVATPQPDEEMTDPNSVKQGGVQNFTIGQVGNSGNNASHTDLIKRGIAQKQVHLFQQPQYFDGTQAVVLSPSNLQQPSGIPVVEVDNSTSLENINGLLTNKWTKLLTDRNKDTQENILDLLNTMQPNSEAKELSFPLVFNATQVASATHSHAQVGYVMKGNSMHPKLNKNRIKSVVVSH